MEAKRTVHGRTPLAALTILALAGLLLAACGASPTPTAPTARATLPRGGTVVTLPTAAGPTSPPAPTVTPTPPAGPVASGPHPGWTSYTNANFVSDMAFDQDGSLWFVGGGGAVHMRTADAMYDKYTTADGLASNNVQSVAVGTDRTVWFGTYRGGVSRYDGKDWLNYDLREMGGFVSAIAVGGDGALWFGGNYIARFDGQAWTIYTEKDGLPKDLGYVHDIAVASDGAVWFATGAGALRFDGQAWTTYSKADGLAGDVIDAVAVAPDGTLWFATGLTGISHFDGRTWTTYTETTGLGGLADTIAVAPDGTVWAVGGGTVAHLVGGEWLRYNPSSRITCIALDVAGVPWFGSEGHGVLQFVDGKTWNSYATQDNLPNNRVEDLMVAPNGDVWVAPFNEALAHFNGQEWTTYKDDQGADRKAGHFVAAPDGSIWTAGAYIYRFDGQHWSTYGEDAGLPKGSGASAVAVAGDGTLWFGTGFGVSHFDGNTFTRYTTKEGLVGDRVTSVAVAPAGTVWVGTEAGLARFDGTTWSSYSTTNGLPGAEVTALAVAPDGILWAGTLRGGVARFDGQAWTTYADPPGGIVEALAVQPDGVLWVASAYGAFRFDGQAWTRFTPADGLAGMWVLGVAVAPDGAIWFATEDGVSRYLPPR